MPSLMALAVQAQTSDLLLANPDFDYNDTGNRGQKSISARQYRLLKCKLCDFAPTTVLRHPTLLPSALYARRIN